MFIETLVLKNFQCFGPTRNTIDLGADLTAFIGTNGTGKTAACEALLRLFGITSQDRDVRIDDFHVPVNEEGTPDVRELTIEQCSPSRSLAMTMIRAVMTTAERTPTTLTTTPRARTLATRKSSMRTTSTKTA